MTVDAVYRGFTFRISNRTVGILRDGRLLDTVTSVPKARAFVKGYRHEERINP